MVLGNIGNPEDVDALARGLDDPEPVPSASSGQAVRDHAAWALGRIDTAAARGTPHARHSARAGISMPDTGALDEL